jgi:hypothetical protein
MTPQERRRCAGRISLHPRQLIRNRDNEGKNMGIQARMRVIRRATGPYRSAQGLASRVAWVARPFGAGVSPQVMAPARRHEPR